jgi:shikimate dehydrogenase
VLGHPIGHSLSPVLHRAAYAQLGLDWTYEAVDVSEAGLAEFVTTRGPEWVGLSLTMPLKQAVLPLLDDRDDTVELVGAANTLLWRGGRRVGANTDAAGLVSALREAGVGAPATAGVLGAGATAASALVALAELGCRDVALAARRPEATTALVELAGRLGVILRVVGWPRAASVLDAPLALSTVPSGVADGLAGGVPGQPEVLFDVVYAPWPTPLAAAWTHAGGRVLSGLDLLVHQAAGQVRLMTGRDVEVEVLRRALDTRNPGT